MDCGRAIASKKSVQPRENGSSAKGKAAAHDLLPWPIRTRQRGSRRRPAVVAIEVGQPSELPESEKAATDLPLKKRICKEAAPALEENRGSGTVAHSFDLNKLPEPEDEQEM